jgi:YidC/Oxa1 family membrane protein insertase
MTETNRNMILAIVLSMVVIFGWQFLVAGPQQERAARQAQIAAEQAAAANPGIATTTTGNGTVAPEPTARLSR